MAEAWDVAWHRRAALPLSDPRRRASRSALSDVTEHGYLQAEQTLREVHARQAPHAATLDLGRDAQLEYGSPTGRCVTDLVYRVRERTLPDRRVRADAPRARAASARREPSLLREPTAWALLAGSVVGPRAVDAAKGSRVGRRTPRRRSTPISAPRIVASALTDSRLRMCGLGRSIVL